MTDKQNEQLNQAQQALKAGETEKALKKLATLNDEVDAYEVNLAYVKSLTQAENYTQALVIANERRFEYQNSATGVELLINLELKNGNFINARLLVESLPEIPKNRFQKNIHLSEHQALVLMPQTLRTRQQHFFHLGDGGFIKQQRNFNDAVQLPLDLYLQGSQFVLRDPFVKPIIKSSLVQVLVKLKINKEFKLLWLDNHENPIIPAKFATIETHPTVEHVYHVLQHKYENNDPITYHMRLQQFNLQVALLYPFINKAIIDPQKWVAIMGTPRQGGEAPIVQEMRNWQERLNQILVQMGI